MCVFIYRYIECMYIYIYYIWQLSTSWIGIRVEVLVRGTTKYCPGAVPFIGSSRWKYFTDSLLEEKCKQRVDVNVQVIRAAVSTSSEPRNPFPCFFRYLELWWDPNVHTHEQPPV